MRTDGRTDMMMMILPFRNFEKAPKNTLAYNTKVTEGTRGRLGMTTLTLLSVPIVAKLSSAKVIMWLLLPALL